MAQSRRLGLALIALATTACSPKSPTGTADDSSPTGSPPSASAKSGTLETGAAPPPGVLRAYYWTCEGGLEFVARNLWRENAVTLDLHAGSRRLERVPSASGTKYADSSIEFWTKGSAGTFGHQPAAPVKCTEIRARSLVEDARARGVAFRARGNEPGWIVEIGPQERIVFETQYGNERHEFAAARATGELTGRGLRYAAEEDGQPIEVVVRSETCQDDMSGESFDLSVVVTYAGSTLRGCGARLRGG
jgi:putative lipoprotein